MEKIIKLNINIDCAGCALKVEEALNKDQRIIKAIINFAKRKVTIKYHDGIDILKVVNEIAVSVEPDCVITENKIIDEGFNFYFYLGSAIGLIFIALAIITKIFKVFELNNWILFSGFVVAYLLVGYNIALKSIKNITNGNIFDENFLMLLASIGSIVVAIITNDICFEAFLVVFLYRIGEAIQDKAIYKSNKKIDNLKSLKTEIAHLENGKTVYPVNVEIDTILMVKPGEIVPIDGIIVKGKTSFDVSKLNGESIPADLEENDQVLSGSINIGNVVLIKTIKSYNDSTANRIIELVDEASFKKAKSESFIAKFAKIYTPVVIALAVIIFLFEFIFLNNQFGFVGSLENSLVFLVSSCPCALVISIPLVIYAGIGKCSSIGILVKGGNYLEALSKADHFCFDKTGTITKGNFKVASINVLHEEDLEKVKFVLTLEKYSAHPIAKAITEYLGEFEDYSFTDIKEIPGYGITAMIDGCKVFVGNDKLMKENGIVFVKSNQVGSVIYCAIDEYYLGNVLVVDEIKEESYTLFNGLKKNKVKTAIITGDKKEVALDVGKKLKIDEVYYEKLPAEKLNILEQIIKNKEKNSTVVYVGDGINDTPSIKLADIGVAIGSVGNDEVIENADVVLMNDKIDSFYDAIKISKKVNSIIIQNIVISLAIKIAVMVIGALGLIGSLAMLLGVLADVGVCLICIINALRVLRMKGLKKNG